MQIDLKTSAVCCLLLFIFSYQKIGLATVYADAESGAIGWSVYDNTPAGARVFSVFDANLQSQIIQTQGAGRNNTYMLGSRTARLGWNNTDEDRLNWKMASSEPWVVIVHIVTTGGIRRLIYNQSNSDLLDNPGNNSIHYGLGSSTLDGQWREFERDLAADISFGEPGITLLSVNGIELMGSFRVDDIVLDNGGEVVEPPVSLPPIAVINASETSGVAPLAVSFDATGSAAAGAATVTTIRWDFGNGDSATTALASSIYTQAGSYSAMLTVTDSNGMTDTASVGISVNANDVYSCQPGVSTTNSVAIPRLSKPAYLRPYTDPVLGGRVMRITNSAFAEVRKPPYSTMQAWNADESYLLLYKSSGNGTGSGHILLDGHSYAPLRNLSIVPADIEEVYWSHTDSDEFFYISKAAKDYGLFKRYSVAANVSSDIADFSAYCGTNLPRGGYDVHMQSLDDDLFGFRCRGPSGRDLMFSYRISSGEIISAPIGEGTQWSNFSAPMPGPSGDRFWFQGAALAPDLRTVQQRMDMRKVTEHSTVGQTYAAQDALYQISFNESPSGCNGDAYGGLGQLVEHNLETGECRAIIGRAQGYPSTGVTTSTHLSAQSYLRPGLVAMSTIGNRSQLGLFSNNSPAPALFSEIYLADTDPDNPVVCRLAHHRSYGKSANRGGYPAYFGEPHATISPSGTRILFGSDWYNSGAVDSFVIELPGYQRP